MGRLLKALRAKYNQLSQAVGSAEAVESAEAAESAEATESAEAAGEPEEPGLALQDAGVSLLEIHAVAHTKMMPCPACSMGGPMQ